MSGFESSWIEGSVMEAEKICRLAEGIDPTVGIAIITRDYKVKWANREHLKRWPKLIGKVCYKYVNGFTRHCNWCPVQKTFEDKKMHNVLVCSPNKSVKGLEWDIVFSNIVSVPVIGADGEVSGVVEAVFDNTVRQKEILEKQLDRYKAFSEFGEVVERLSSEVYVPDYLLLGAVWERSLNSSAADVFIIEEADVEGTWRVKEYRSIQKSECGEVLEKFDSSLSQKALSHLRGRMSKVVEEKKFPDQDMPFLENEMAQRYNLTKTFVENQLRLSQPALRFAPNTVATKILGTTASHYLLVTRTIGTGHDLTTDRDLLDVGIYGSVVERAIRNRELAIDVKSVLDKVEPLFGMVEKDLGAMVFSASVVSSFTHDLRLTCERISDQVENMWYKVDRVQRTAIERYRKVAKKEIAFMKACLSRAIEVARMNRIKKSEFWKADIHVLIAEVRDSFEKLFTDNRITFSFSPGMRNGKLICEPLLLKQVLGNLIMNACSSLEGATHRVRELKVRTERDKDWLNIIVEDNGRGIDPAIKEQIWRPFFSTKGKGVGTGLGLMICKRIVKDIHDGDIMVESKHGYWTKFTVKIPIIDNE